MTNSITPKELLIFCTGAHYKKDIIGWNTIKVVNGSQDDTKLDASVYKNGDRIVIAFSGTYPNSATDLKNDVALMSTKIPSQYGSAEKLYNEIKTQYPNANIEFCGYSLGGSIANLLSHRTGLHSTALAPIGSKHVAKAHSDYFKYDDSNIVSFGRKEDKLFYRDIDKQSGEVFEMPSINEWYIKNVAKHFFKGEFDLGIMNFLGGRLAPYFGYNSKTAINHFLHEYKETDMEPSKKIQDAERWNNQNQTKFQSPVPQYNKTYENLSYDDRVYYQGDEPTAIWDKDDEDVTKQDELEFKVFNRQVMNDNWKLPTKEELDERVARGELIWVDGYTKQDGTVVKGYFRHYPETA